MNRRAATTLSPALLPAAYRVEMAVFLVLVAFTYLTVTRPFVNGNPGARIGLTLAIVERGELNIDALVAEGNTDDWARYRVKFVRVFPNEYRRALSELAAKGRKLAA